MTEKLNAFSARSLTIETPEGVAFSLPLAGPISRFLAWIVDTLVIGVALDTNKAPMFDLDMRAKWDDFMTAYEEVFARTSTEYAPWWIVPANRKWYRDLCVSRILVDVLTEMDPHYPKKTLDAKKIVIPD